VNLRLFGAAGPRFPPTDARLDATLGPRDTRLALRIARTGHPLASASLIWKVPSSRLRDRAALRRAPLELSASVGPLRVHRSGLPGSSDLPTSDELTATLQAAVSVHGSLARPELLATASVRDGHLGKQPVGSADATLTYAAGRIGADARLRSASGGELHMEGHATANLGYPQVSQLDTGAIPFDARLDGHAYDLAWTSALGNSVRSVAGKLSAAVSVHGTPRAPHAAGQLEWTHGAVTLTGLGAYRDVHLKAHGDENGVSVDELRLSSGDGDARLTARATRTGANGGLAVEASTSLHRFPIYGQGQALATVSVDGHATGTASARRIQAVAKVSEAHIELNDVKQKKLQSLQRPPDILLVDGSRPANTAEAKRLAQVDAVLLSGEDVAKKAAPAPPAPQLSVRLGIDAPRNLWVQGEDASLELGLGPDFHVESSGTPAVYGQVLVRRGRIDVFGRRFDVQAGSLVNFVGPPDQPRLDVTAKHFNEGENISVLLTAKGSLDKLSISVRSPERPDLTEGQLYTLIVTGKLQFGGSGNSAGSASAAGEAASLVGGVVASQLQKTLARKLPLDVLTLQAGDEGGLTGSRLEAGTYLTSKLYAGYVGRVGANPALLQNRNAVHVEYQLSRRWSFNAEYGDVGTGTADLLWTKNY
jgi:translocation and assembly module TamB